MADAKIELLEDRQLMSVATVTHNEIVRLDTTAGLITVELTPNVTPLTVHNFLANYVQKKLYDNTLIHRSVPGFVIQGGGFKFAPSYPFIKQAAPIPNEIASDSTAADGGPVNLRGTIAMAKLGSDPDSATSEWFINLADNSSNLDYQNGGFTVFGNVIGGGMHTVDAIAALKVTDDSKVNGAFGEIPVTHNGEQNNFVVVKSARAMDELAVSLNTQIHQVIWTDENGANGSISLSHGSANLKFTGVGLHYAQLAGGILKISGTEVQLSEVSTHSTNKNSILTITSAGSANHAIVGDITTDGPLKQISAPDVWLEGDLSSAGPISRIDFNGTHQSTLNISGAGALTINVANAIDTSISTTMDLASLSVTRWTSDGALPSSISAALIDQIAVKNGTFTATVHSDKRIGSVRVADIHSSHFSSVGPLFDLEAHYIEDTTIDAPSVGKLIASGAMTRDTVKVINDIGSVTAASLYSTTLAVDWFPDDDYFTLTPGPAGFNNVVSRIGPVTLTAPMNSFVKSVIAAPNLGILKLGSIPINLQGSQYGIVTLDTIPEIQATFSGKSIILHNIKTSGAASAAFQKAGIKLGLFTVEFAPLI
ncbi:MAG TPA: peptidylprolyl isomerase [Tepidisphaeraceae bacterium]|jgi:cyclophilin family peptidyl-prolyl cis-trans isomerase|nr:peptidylprolyl isomerase [Tepidisphaeraceae bacterium]